MIHELTAIWLAIPWGYRLLLVSIAAMVVMGLYHDWRYPHGEYDNRVQGTGNGYGRSRTHKGGSGR